MKKEKKMERKPIKGQWRHGDLLMMDSDIPIDAKRRENNIIAYGEGTGHFHHLTGGNAAVLEKDGTTYWKADSGAIEHSAPVEERHKALPLDAPAQKVIRPQFEYNPYDDAMRQVRD